MILFFWLHNPPSFPPHPTPPPTVSKHPEHHLVRYLHVFTIPPITGIIWSTQQKHASAENLGGGQLPIWMYGPWWATTHIPCMRPATIGAYPSWNKNTKYRRNRARTPLVFWIRWIASKLNIISPLQHKKRYRTHQNRACCLPALPGPKTLDSIGTRVHTPLVFWNRQIECLIDIINHLECKKWSWTHQNSPRHPHALDGLWCLHYVDLTSLLELIIIQFYL